ncbi:MAG: hypothetical protein IKB38_07240 [Clostridia bacterium]|nr:hypothetical protein [Clostridia bacterium]
MSRELRLSGEGKELYRGYYRDSETGFYYLNSRYYDPAIGRFNFNNHSIGLGVDVGLGISFHLGFSFSISGFLISLYD